jgi:His-Xaa-Ser system protein HxsD
MANTNRIQNGEIIAVADGTLYSSKTVFKCIYWFGDKFHVNVQQESSREYVITLRPMPDANIPEGELFYYLQKLERDLVDFHLREIVSKETGSIRELLVAKAFSNGEYDEAPPGEVSDPVGFAPLL